MDNFKNPKRNDFTMDAKSSDEIQNFTENGAEVLDDGLGPKWMVWRRRRYLVIVMAFLGQLTKEALRTNLTVAVFPMTENHSITDENGTTTYVQDFDWDVKTRGFLLSVFYYGYVATHILGGVLAVRYGGTKMYGLGVVITAASTLLTPAAASTHLYVLISLRIFEGLCEGILTPSVELIFSRWIPLEERSSLVAFTASGSSVGVVFGVAISSALSYSLGWPAVFYFTGAAGIVWYVAWLMFVAECPAMDKKINPSELNYIQYSTGKQQRGRQISSIPFLRMSTSLPILALVCSSVPTGMTYVIFSTQLPAYIKDVLRVNTENSGYLSSSSFAVKVLGVLLLSPVADCLIRRKIFAAITIRKLYICGGLLVVTALCFLIQQVTTIMAVMACLLLINICCGSAVIQIKVNMLDLAPQYSSVLDGLTITANSMCGIFFPTAIGYLTQNKTAEEWHIVFSIQAGVCFVAAAVYCVFGSTKLQSWATEKYRANAECESREE